MRAVTEPSFGMEIVTKLKVYRINFEIMPDVAGYLLVVILIWH